MSTITTTPTLPADLRTPAVIDHVTFIGIRQLKRVDSVEFGVDADPRLRQTLGVGDLGRPLARLMGDTVDEQGRPAGVIRGWRTYVYADEPLDVVVDDGALEAGQAVEVVRGTPDRLGRRGVVLAVYPMQVYVEFEEDGAPSYELLSRAGLALVNPYISRLDTGHPPV